MMADSINPDFFANLLKSPAEAAQKLFGAVLPGIASDGAEQGPGASAALTQWASVAQRLQTMWLEIGRAHV